MNGARGLILIAILSAVFVVLVAVLLGRGL